LLGAALRGQRVTQVVGVRLEGDHLTLTPVSDARDVDHLDLDASDVDHHLRVGRQHDQEAQ
jgi:hypothetical protein